MCASIALVSCNNQTILINQQVDALYDRMSQEINYIIMN